MITKTKLEQLLKTKKEEAKDFFYLGDYHDIGLSELEDIVDMLEDGTEYEDFNEVLKKLQYNRAIMDYADSSTPIFYNKFAKWFGENWTAVDEYCDKFGDVVRDSRGKSDIMKTIQCAYCMTYERDLTSALEKLTKELEEVEV